MYSIEGHAYATQIRAGHQRSTEVLISFISRKSCSHQKFDEHCGTQEARGKGKIALVTGISGMLGSHVAEALLDRGYEVHGVVRPRSNLRNVAAFQSRAKMIIAELTDPWRVLRLVQKLKPDFIFHFAAQAFNSLSFEQPAETLHTNLMSAFGFF